jgi:Xaa-Pro dipeptidase
LADIRSLYETHLASVVDHYSAALSPAGKNGVLIASGSAKAAFLDDHTYPFVVNPHFKWCLPIDDVPDSFVLLRQGERPRLFFNQPEDYWHKPPAAPSGFWADAWDIQTIGSVAEIHNEIGDASELVFIGEEDQIATSLGIESVNTPPVLDAVHFARAYKSAYEMHCIEAANVAAARGHLAAEVAFREGLSEFEIQHAYLAAVRSREIEAPYSGIVALNENCAVLHYQHYELSPPAELYSMLIDAGASYHGYAADVTRTHSYETGAFSELIERMDAEQLAIIDDIEPGMNYETLHRKMHHRLAVVLKDFDLVRMDPDSMVEENVTFTFLPHGLGHFLGLQTHDVGGHQQNREGETRPAPDEYPALRLNRIIEAGQVFTIEPGLYFIPMLLKQLKETQHGSKVNWPLVESLLRYGGIRIEDNVAIRDNDAWNITRSAFKSIGVS